MTGIEQIKTLLDQCPEEQQREILSYLRQKYPIHPIEAKLNTPAEVILEAIYRANDLSLRGVRGLIAEAAFEIYIVRGLSGWNSQALMGNPAYDYLLEDTKGPVRVQIKMQRLKAQQPMMANQAYKSLPPDMYVVETQRTRTGRDQATGEDTRPYRFGEFDILAVSMYPSTQDWSKFLYTVADWLVPRAENPYLLLKFQPVSRQPDENWTDDFEACVAWLRTGTQKRIWEPPASIG